MVIYSFYRKLHVQLLYIDANFEFGFRFSTPGGVAATIGAALETLRRIALPTGQHFFDLTVVISRHC